MYTLEQMSGYLGQLGSYLGSYVLPDFSELDDVIGQAFAEGTQEFADEKARALEEAVARYNEEQRQRREAEAAERQRLERQELIDALSKRHRELPALPTAQELALLPPDAATPATLLVAAAQKAITDWALALAGTPEDFGRLQLAAGTAVDQARSALELLPGQVATELERRRLPGQRVASEGQAALRELNPKWTELAAKSNSVKNLKAAMTEHEQAALALQNLLRSGGPGEFDAALQRVDTALKDLTARIKTVNGVLTTKEQQGAEALRLQQLQLMRWQRFPPLQGERLTVLSGEPSLEAYNGARLRYDQAFDRLQQASAEAFAEQRKLTVPAFEELDQAYDKATAAFEAALKNRRQLRLDQREVLTRLEEAEPKAVVGTDEAKLWDKARQNASQALYRLVPLTESATPEEFARALQEAKALLATAAEVHQQTMTVTRQRLERVRLLKEALAQAVATARSGLPRGPSPEVAGAVATALDDAASDCERRIEGKDEGLDRASVEGFTARAEALVTLTKYLKQIKPTAFTPVAANAAVRAEIDKLLQLLKGVEGLGLAAANQADTLSKKVARVAESYRLIADLLARHGDILSHARFDPAWRPELSPFPEFERSKDSKLQDALSKGINDFTGTFGEIEARMRKRERADVANAIYAASYEGKFIEYWDDNGRGPAITELGRLVGLGVASQGDIKRCYLAGDDDESMEEFSVEIVVDIDGRHGVVVHAHCDGLGVPKAGHACHFKLANNKREGGNSCTLDATLRNAFLPSAGYILSERPGKWEGRRPDYV